MELSSIADRHTLASSPGYMFLMNHVTKVHARPGRAQCINDSDGLRVD